MLQWWEWSNSSGVPTEWRQSHQPLTGFLHWQLDLSKTDTVNCFGNVILRANLIFSESRGYSNKFKISSCFSSKIIKAHHGFSSFIHDFRFIPTTDHCMTSVSILSCCFLFSGFWTDAGEGSWYCTRNLQSLPLFFIVYLVKTSHLFDSSIFVCNVW